jgi:hypothetical protein
MLARALGLVLLVALCCRVAAFGQAPATLSTDIYANFVGTWVGTDRYLKDGAMITVLLRLEISETKKKDGLQCVYTYGEKGQKGFERSQRRITLNPSDGEMTSQWKRHSTEHYKAKDLDEFAKTGLGTFTSATEVKEDGKTVMYEGVFSLSKDKFFYRWDKSSDGKTFVTNGVFTLEREALVASPASRP